MHTGAEGLPQEVGSQSLTASHDDTEEGNLPLRLREELRKQKHLYDEIISKTRQLQDLQSVSLSLATVLGLFIMSHLYLLAQCP